jgi:hypothetical protein
MMEAEHVKQSVNDEGKKSFVKGQARLVGLSFCAFHGDDEVPDYLRFKAVQIGKGDDVRGGALAEAFPVERRDPLVVGKKDADVSILQP